MDLNYLLRNAASVGFALLLGPMLTQQRVERLGPLFRKEEPCA